MELIIELRNKIDSMVEIPDEIETLGIALAQAENEYKKAVSIRTLQLKNDKQPATLIQLIIHGDSAVEMLRLQRDIAKVHYDSKKEKLNVLKISTKIINDQIKLDMGRA